MVHQDYRLVPFLSVHENLLLAAELRGLRRNRGDSVSALARVHLPEAMLDRLPATLSGGEQQRVAIARSLTAATPVLLADEPTGALDADNTDRVADILVELGREHGLIVVVATHDGDVGQRMDHCLRLRAGHVASAA